MNSRMKNRALLALLLLVNLLGGCSPSGSHAIVPRPNTSNQTAQRIHQELPRYQQLARQSWPTIHLTKALKFGDQHHSIPLIRQRLKLLGDLPTIAAVENTQFDQSLVLAIRSFQWRHGLKNTGVIDAKTLAALNVTPKQRLHQLVKSMQQWAKFPEHEGARYLRVNVASFDLDVVEQGKRIMNMRVVAGKPSRETPELYSKVETIVLNPGWNLPKTIVARDIIPGMQRDPNYLADRHIKMYSSWKKDAYEVNPASVDWQTMSAANFPYKLSQPPGNSNPLGRVKFVFLNDDDIYMHDTPQKGLFKQIMRAYSSGCLRVEKPFQLVEYFLRENPDEDRMSVSAHLDLEQGETKYIRIKNPVPIYITYITAWVDEHRKIHFREDIYKRH